jgi:hypothetical protein
VRANLGHADRQTTDRQRAAGGQRLWVYGRAGRPCRRCGTLIEVRRHGELPRATYWCPGCQVIGAGAPAAAGGMPRTMAARSGAIGNET